MEPRLAACSGHPSVSARGQSPQVCLRRQQRVYAGTVIHEKQSFYHVAKPWSSEGDCVFFKNGTSEEHLSSSVG